MPLRQTKQTQDGVILYDEVNSRFSRTTVVVVERVQASNTLLIILQYYREMRA